MTFELAVVSADDTEDDEDTILSKHLAVADDDILDITDRETVHEHQ